MGPWDARTQEPPRLVHPAYTGFVRTFHKEETPIRRPWRERSPLEPIVARTCRRGMLEAASAKASATRGATLGSGSIHVPCPSRRLTYPKGALWANPPASTFRRIARLTRLPRSW